MATYRFNPDPATRDPATDWWPGMFAVPPVRDPQPPPSPTPGSTEWEAAADAWLAAHPESQPWTREREKAMDEAIRKAREEGS